MMSLLRSYGVVGRRILPSNTLPPVEEAKQTTSFKRTGGQRRGTHPLPGPRGVDALVNLDGRELELQALALGGECQLAEFSSANRAVVLLPPSRSRRKMKSTILLTDPFPRFRL